MKKILLYIAFTLPLAALTAQNLTPEQINHFKKQVLAKNQTIQTIQANFVQKKHLDFMTKDIETFGTMAFVKPDRLNWQYTKPYQYRIVFQKNNIKVNDAGKISEMKADNKIFKKINSLIVSTISGDMFNEKEFKITFTQKQNSTQVHLLPTDKTLLKYISQIELHFSPDYVVERVKLIEPTNDYTEIQFNNKQLNTPIDENHFKI